VDTLTDILPLDVLQRYEALKQLTPKDLLETDVRLIAIPLPPSPVRGLLYDPFAYVSSTFDNVFEKESSENGDVRSDKSYDCISMLPTNQGPAFYITAPLGTLISMSRCERLNRYGVSVRSSAFCAAIEYDEKRAGRTTKESSAGLVDAFADKVRLLSMQLVGRSCHGGSHLIVPGAPYLTALLQANSAPGDTIFFEEKAEDSRVAARYGRPWIEESGALFPDARWDRNTSVDMVVSESFVGRWRPVLNIDDVVVFPYRDCIGNWAQPYLQTLTRNILTPLGVSNGSPTYYSRVRNDLEEIDRFDSTPEIGDPISEGVLINPC
jgi:hypothetical protein